jgi:hypothetical protein
MKRIKFGRVERFKGEKMPPNTKKVDRSTKYGNPFKLEEFSREDSLKLYKIYIDWVVDKKKLLSLEPLRGYNLACSCKLDENCHVDILLDKIKNTP